MFGLNKKENSLPEANETVTWEIFQSMSSDERLRFFNDKILNYSIGNSANHAISKFIEKSKLTLGSDQKSFLVSCFEALVLDYIKSDFSSFLDSFKLDEAIQEGFITEEHKYFINCQVVLYILVYCGRFSEFQSKIFSQVFYSLRKSFQNGVGSFRGASQQLNIFPWVLDEHNGVNDSVVRENLLGL